jgi:hypothetical protein
MPDGFCEIARVWASQCVLDKKPQLSPVFVTLDNIHSIFLPGLTNDRCIVARARTSATTSRSHNHNQRPQQQQLGHSHSHSHSRLGCVLLLLLLHVRPQRVSVRHPEQASFFVFRLLLLFVLLLPILPPFHCNTAFISGHVKQSMNKNKSIEPTS